MERDTNREGRRESNRDGKELYNDHKLKHSNKHIH